MRSAWEPLGETDLARLEEIERVVHPGLPERPEVMAEKMRLFPAGCRKLVRDGRMVGYGLSHPWRIGDVPHLDAFLGALPREADCLHMHDVAILPEGRGGGAARRYVAHLWDAATQAGFRALACVSVYGTTRLWGSLGFVEEPHVALPPEYGPTARYMIARDRAL